MIETNLRGERVEQCARRFLRDALREAPLGERMEYCRNRAWNCIRNFKHYLPQEYAYELRNFYARVFSHFTEG